MSQAGFYGWIREGVKRAVLLGVSDAVEQLGTPDAGDDVSQQLLAVLREGRPRGGTALLEEPVSAKVAGGGRKRLGRSLEQIVESSQKTS